MSDWLIITPEGTTNLVENPSFEVNVTDFWTLAGGGAVARSTTRARFGVASAQLTSAAGVTNRIASDNVALANGETIYAQVYVYRPSAVSAELRIRDVTNGVTRATVATTETGAWELLQVSWLNNTGGGVNVSLWLTNGAQDGATNVWFDAAQAEIDTSTYTTYCDGEQLGCEWLGTPHDSDSQRSAQSRAGGVVEDLQDDYHLNVSAFIGTGMPPQALAVDSYAILPGGQLNSIKTHSRVFTLVGFIQGENLNQVHEYRQDLLNVLKPDAVPEVDGIPQPVLIRYTGADTDKEIAVHYEAGLEANIDARQPCWENPVAVRFLAPDPFWYEVGESAQLLDSNDSATVRIVAGRLRSTGQWDELGPPNVAGTYGAILAVAIGPDGLIYYGGNFQNFDNIAAADYIVSYDPQTGTWAALAGGLNANVRALEFAPDGTLYVGGDFTNAGGDANADYLCQWNGVAFSSVNATPLNNFVYALEYGPNGILYIGGNFTNAGGDPNADRVCQMSTAGVFSSLNATPLGNTVIELVATLDGTLYIGGNFINAGGDADADYVCQYDYIGGGAFTSLNNTPLNNFVQALAYSEERSTLYIGGYFTDAGGDANGDYICQYTGTSFVPLGSGMNNSVLVLSIGPDGMLYACGQFTIAGGIGVADRAAKWNGASWAHLDLNLPGAPLVQAVALGNPDPVVTANYDIWIGFSTTGTAYFAGTATAANGGTATAYPRVYIHRSGGTSATLIGVRNETIGRELLFDYDLQDSEDLTVDLSSANKNVYSDYWGPRPDAILANSDFGTFALQPGNNQITCFVDVAGAPTIEAYMIWRDAYWSTDD